MLISLFERDYCFGKVTLDKQNALRDPDMVRSLCGLFMTFSLRIPEEAVKLAEKITIFLFQTMDCLEKIIQKQQSEIAKETEICADRYEDIFLEVYAASEHLLTAIKKSKAPENNKLLESLTRRYLKRAWELYEFKKLFQDEFIHLMDWICVLHKAFPKGCLTKEQIDQETDRLFQAWHQITSIQFEDAEETNQENITDDDLRYSVCDIASVIINNHSNGTHEAKIKLVKDIVQVIFEKFKNSLDNEQFFNNELSHAMYLLVSIIEHSDFQFIVGNLDWMFYVQESCKYAAFQDNVLRQNSCFLLGK